MISPRKIDLFIENRGCSCQDIETVCVTQYDNYIPLQINLYENKNNKKTPLAIPSGYTAYFNIAYASGEVSYLNCIINSDSTLTVSLTNTTLSILGRAGCQVTFIGDDDSRFSTNIFYLQVGKTLGNDSAVEGIPEFTYFAEQLSILADMLGSVNSLTTSITKGIVYDTLADRLESSEGDIITLSDNKLDKIDIINDLITGGETEVLSAEQGKKLHDEKIAKTSIADNLTSDDANKVLSAKQGKYLGENIDGINNEMMRLNLQAVEDGKKIRELEVVAANANPNNEPRATTAASQLPTVTLPKTVAGGALFPTISGTTATNLTTYNRSTWAEWVVTGEGTITKDSSGMTLSPIDYAQLEATYTFETPLKPSLTYGILLEVLEKTFSGSVYVQGAFDNELIEDIFTTGIVAKKIKTGTSSLDSMVLSMPSENGSYIKIKNIRVFELPDGSDILNNFNTLTAEQLNEIYPYFDDTKSAIAPRLRATDKDGNNPTTQYATPYTLRKLPNGVADTINNGKYTNRVNAYTIKSSDLSSFDSLTNVDYVLLKKPLDYVFYGNSSSLAANKNVILQGLTCGTFSDNVNAINTIYNSTTTDFGILLEKGKYTLSTIRVELTGKTLYYQLTSPIITENATRGLLIGSPGGTVTAEPALNDVGFYDDNFLITNTDFPIIALDSLYRVNVEDGASTKLDETVAVIASDGLSFTHPGLMAGDLVDVDYFYEGKTPRTSQKYSYLDSNHVKQDSVTGTFYRRDWEVVDGQYHIVLKEVQ